MRSFADIHTPLDDFGTPCRTLVTYRLQIRVLILSWPPRTLLWTVTIKGSSVQGACCLLHQFSSTSIYFPQVEDSLCPLLGASPRYFIFRWQRQANIMVVTNQFTDPAVDYPDNLMLDFIRNLFLNHHYNCIIVY